MWLDLAALSLAVGVLFSVLALAMEF